MVELQKAGLSHVDHFKEIKEEDLKLMYLSFDLSNPVGLQWKVMFDILFYLCRRGKENRDKMTGKIFDVKGDNKQRSYIMQVEDKMLKNHRENDNEISEGQI